MNRQERNEGNRGQLRGIGAFLRSVEEQYRAVRSGRMVLLGNRRHAAGASLNSGASESRERRERHANRRGHA